MSKRNVTTVTAANGEDDKENTLTLCCSDVWGHILNNLMHLDEYARVFYMIHSSPIWKEGAKKGVRHLVVEDRIIGGQYFNLSLFECVESLKIIFKTTELDFFHNENTLMVSIVLNHAFKTTKRSNSDVPIVKGINSLHLVNNPIIDVYMLSLHFNHLERLTIKEKVGPLELPLLSRMFPKLTHFTYDVAYRDTPTYAGDRTMKDVYSSFNDKTIVEDITFDRSATRFAKRTGYSICSYTYTYKGETFPYICECYLENGQREGKAKVTLLDFTNALNGVKERSCHVVYLKDMLVSRTGIRMDYANGASYTGDINDSFIAHGNGHYIEKNGDSFKGLFDHGKYRAGKRIFLNRFSFEGFYNDKGNYDGKAIMHFFLRKETIYVEYANGVALPHIFIDYEDGRNYQGEHLQLRPNGKGVLIIPNGDQFEGSFKNTNPFEGKYTTKDKEQVFIGNFEDFPKMKGIHYKRVYYDSNRIDDDLNDIDLTNIH
jgi:hypothetical protein